MQLENVLECTSDQLDCQQFHKLNDVNRVHQLILRVKNVEQVLITAAVMEDVPKELVGNKLFVNNGKVESL